MHYDPNFVKVETSQGEMQQLRDAVVALQSLAANVEIGANALENGADSVAMAAYFRVALCEAIRKCSLI